MADTPKIKLMSNLNLNDNSFIIKDTTRITFPDNPIEGIECLVNGINYIYTILDGFLSWIPTSINRETKNFTIEPAEQNWVISHNWNTDISKLDIICYNSDNKVITGNIAQIDKNSFSVAFSSAVAGRITLFNSVGAGGEVVSVNGKTGIVIITKEDIELGKVDNTSDIEKSNIIDALLGSAVEDDIALDDEILGKPLKTINGNSLIGTGNILLRNSDYVETTRKGKNALYLNGVLNETNASVLLQGITPQKDDEIIFSDGNVKKSIILKDNVNEDEDGYYTYVQSDPEVQDIFGDESCTHVFGFNNTLKSSDGQFEFKKLNGTSVVGEYVEGLNNTALLPSNLGAVEVKGLRPSLENLSLSLWVKPIKNPTQHGSFLTVAGVDIMFDATGKFGIAYSGGSYRCNTSINLNEWYLITIVSPTSNLSNIKMYINKNLQTLTRWNNWNTAAKDLTLSLTSGYEARVNDYSHIDTLRLFNRALTIEEISSLYNNNGAITTEVRHNMGVIPTIANKMNVVKNINLLTYPNDDKAKADGLVSGDMYVDNNGFIKLVMG